VRDAVGSVQSVLLLGGSSDIGLAIVRALVEDGTRTVVLAARRPHELDVAADQLRAAGAASVDLVGFDAGARDDHDEVISQIFERHRDIDVAILAFGVLGDASTNSDRASAVALMQTNVVGSVSVLVPVAERLRRQGHGTLVVLSSVAGERVRKSNFVYGASKAALDGFAQGLGDELHGTGADVVVVRPGFVRSKMTAGREEPPLSTTPEHVAQVVIDGIRRGTPTVWAPPALRWVMFLVRHLPRPLFRRLEF
jgi:decaprenylphospho-beta-D-erythro-pentofuranosid-2-ulose 2-reductase